MIAVNDSGYTSGNKIHMVLIRKYLPLNLSLTLFMIYVDAERLQIRKIREKRIQMSVTRYDTDDTDFLPSVFYSEIYRTS